MEREKWLQSIKDADKAYYEADDPIISDSDYDLLRNEYIKLYGEADLNYTPGKAAKEFVPFKHPLQISSLAKIKAGDMDGLTKWVNKLQIFALEPKLDGLTVVAYPGKTESDPFTFVTRGSGVEGETLPNFISSYEQAETLLCKYPIRGEVFISERDFIDIRSDQIKNGETPFKQIRNAAAGILRSKERSPYIDKLQFYCYDVIGLDKSEEAKLAYIRGFTPFREVHVLNCFESDSCCIEALERFIECYYDECRKLYPIDGIVIKPMRDGTLKEFGSTGHHPNNAVAWKPGKEVYKTTLRSIDFSVGRNKVTPVAVFDPIEIDNTTVTRASLHNKDYFDKMKPRVGDTVFVYKSNEIIPQIDYCIHNGGTPIEWMENVTYDTDTIKFIRDMEFLARKDVLDIETLSIKTARKIVETLNPGSIYDIFNYTSDDFLKLTGFAAKSAEKLYQNIQESRNNVDLPHFFKALCAEGIGRHVGEILGKKYGTIDNFVAAMSTDDFSSLEGIGPNMNTVLHSEDTLKRIEELKKYIIPLEYIQKQDIVTNNIIAGKNFVLTGKAPHPRSYYIDLIEKNGGHYQSSVNAKTDYLIIADVNSTSSKAVKARELNIMLITPNDFEEMAS